MKVAGTATLHATPDQVWAAITNPGVLAGVIPGCQELIPLGENHFGLTVTMGVASIKGSYSGEVQLYDLAPTQSLTMRAAGSGAPGTIDTTVQVRLEDLADGSTRLAYDADAVVGGMVGGVGQRVLTSVAKKTAGLFFASIDDVLTGRAIPAVPVEVAAGPARPNGPVPSLLPAEATAAPSAGSARPFGTTLSASTTARNGLDPGALVAAVLAGALSMAIGVIIGARVGRRAREG
jgi:carbon monoxide dehydrogenase subunit G